MGTRVSCAKMSYWATRTSLVSPSVTRAQQDQHLWRAKLDDVSLLAE